MWVLDKLRGSVETSVLRQTGEGGDRRSGGAAHRSPPPPLPVYSNVLTPDKIPDFFIPPKLACGPPEVEGEEGGGAGEAGGGRMRPSASEQVLGVAGGGAGAKGKAAPPRSPRLASRLLRAANRHIIQIESADEVGVAGDTNADPQSQTAMSLPYVAKTQTSYGFATLKESPHTRRKESLFHCEPSIPVSPAVSPGNQRRTAAGGRGSEGSTLLHPADVGAAHTSPYRYFSGGESDTCSSAESSPFSSPLLSRSASLLRVFAGDAQARAGKAKRALARHSSLSTDECSSAEPSPSAQRRRLRCAGGGGAAAATHDHALQRQHTLGLHRGGALRVAASYDGGAARLRIRVLAAESLYDQQVELKSIHCCVSLCLNPGKKQKQRSNIIKNSRNPVFNEDFFFDGVTPPQVQSLTVKVKVVNKGTSLKRDTLLGEREVPLAKLVSGS